MKVAELAGTGYNGRSLHDYMKKAYKSFQKGEFKTDVLGYQLAKEEIFKNILARNPTIVIGPTGCGKSAFLADIQNAIQDLSREDPRWEIQSCPGHQDAYFLMIAKNALENPKAELKAVVKMLDNQFCPGCQSTLYHAVGDMWPADLLNGGITPKKYAEIIGELPVERTRYDNTKINMEQTKSANDFKHEFIGTPNLGKYFGGGRAIDPQNLGPGKAFAPDLLILEEISRTPRDILECIMQATSDDSKVRKLSLFVGGLFHLDNTIIATSNAPMQGDNAVKERFEFVAWGGLPDHDLAKTIAKDKFGKYIDQTQVPNGYLCEDITRQFLPTKERKIYVSNLALEYVGHVMALSAPDNLRGDLFRGTQEEYMKALGALHASRTDVQRATFLHPRRLKRLVRRMVDTWEAEDQDRIVVTPNLIDEHWKLGTSYKNAVNDASIKVKEMLGRHSQTQGSTMEQAKKQAKNIGSIREDVANLDVKKFRPLVEAIEGTANVPEWAIPDLMQEYLRIAG